LLLHFHSPFFIGKIPNYTIHHIFKTDDFSQIIFCTINTHSFCSLTEYSEISTDKGHY
jgi:hypothetical protein